MSDPSPTGWSDLAEPWRAAFARAWTAYSRGNIGVGAAMTEASGKIVARGRNRVADAEAPSGHLHGSFIAHAEIDLLGQLSPGDYCDHRLFTTFEPCALCSVAIVMSNVGHIAFAAADPLWRDLTRLKDVDPFMAERWPERTGPLRDPIAGFAGLLPLFWFLRRKPDGVVVQAFSDHRPHLLALARTLDTDPAWTALGEGDVELALARVSAELTALQGYDVGEIP